MAEIELGYSNNVEDWVIRSVTFLMSFSRQRKAFRD